jgi:mono/diheme cytochrome c family protein
MKLSLELKGILLGTVSALAAVGITIAAGEIVQPKPARTTVTSAATGNGATGGAGEPLEIPPAGTLANQGYKLFLLNCAHCHGDDARGDEGPDLHGVTKSDARITSMIQNGVKGEMPKFASKLSAADVQALIAFVRTLKG